MSASAPPKSVSFPRPPSRVSSPLPPLRVSSPSRPLITLFVASPTIVSEAFTFEPMMFSMPERLS